MPVQLEKHLILQAVDFNQTALCGPVGSVPPHIKHGLQPASYCQTLRRRVHSEKLCRFNCIGADVF